MDQYTEKLRSGLFEVNLEFGLDVVNASEREVIRKCAMAGNVEPAAHFFYLDVVHIDNFRNPAGDGFQSTFEFGVANKLVSGFDRGRLALDMGKDVGDLGNIVAHVGFEFGDLIVSVLESHTLVEFDVLLNVKPAREILHADVVDVEVVAGSD